MKTLRILPALFILFPPAILQASESARPPGWMFFAPESEEEAGGRLRMDLGGEDFVEHSLPEAPPASIPPAEPPVAQPITPEAPDTVSAPEPAKPSRLSSIPCPATGEIFEVKTEADFRYARSHEIPEVMFRGQRYILTEDGRYMIPADLVLEEVRRMRKAEQDARYYVYPEGAASPPRQSDQIIPPHGYPYGGGPAYGQQYPGASRPINPANQFRTSGGRRRGRSQRSSQPQAPPQPSYPESYYYPVPPPPPMPPGASLNNRR